MSKAVLMSIQPKWVEKIASGEKTIEVRKTTPKLETPFKVYIYETYDKKYANTGVYWFTTRHTFKHGCGKVIGDFVCDRVDKFDLPYPAYFHSVPQETQDLIKNACLTMLETHHYIGTGKGYGLHISDLKIYDKPKELSEFKTPEWFRDCEKGCTDIERMRCPVKNSRKADKMCGWCRGGGEPITRPPQSWCYVED